MYLPAVCGSCGLIFGSLFMVRIGMKFTFEGTSYINCPRCNGQAATLSGTIELLEDGIRLWSGPDFTKEIFEAMKMAVDDVRSGRATVHQAAARIRKKSPEAAKQFREWASLGIAFMGLMVAVAALFLQWKQQENSNLSAEQMVDQAVDDYLNDHYSQPIICSTEIAQRPTVNQKGVKNEMRIEPQKKRKEVRRRKRP
ncbi:hypothetical protein [Paracoccus sp. pheM1]|uniref:hypothetical protein n=1 Tax=Paracoccus sp. pheM1 TaxID=2831675 RepID=UPI001BDB6EB2|nr:hypothetical protein [Paracoccus sp. pheM1]MBT0780544.1 hypothetical protein [Paracoccus sp. pheM1]